MKHFILAAVLLMVIGTGCSNNTKLPNSGPAKTIQYENGDSVDVDKKKKPNNKKDKQDIEVKEDNVTKIQLEGDAVKAAKIDVGVKDFRQINATMARITGVSMTAPGITSIMEQIKDQLPTNNDLKSFAGSNQVAISKLAVEYCDIMIDSNAMRTALVPGFEFDAAPSVAYADSTKKATLINGLINSFWGEDFKDMPDPDKATGELTGLVDELLVGGQMDNAVFTRSVAKGVCTAVLASAPVTLL